MSMYLAISELAAAVERPIADAVGLPNPAYTSPEFFRLELERIFAPSWACLGHACDVPQPGDLRPMRLLGVPLLMARAAGGAVRVFHNVCSHRGNELVWEPCRVKGAIRCPYHAWTYDLEGRLKGTPNIVREPKDGYWSEVWNKKPFCSCYWGARPVEDMILSIAYLSDSPWNDTVIDIPRVDELVVKARGELDQEKRTAMYREVQQLISAEGGTIIPAFGSDIAAVNDKVGVPSKIGGGWEMDGGHFVKRWWMTG